MKGRVLAVDYGEKRTGLASSDALGIAAHPLDPVLSTSLDETVEAIAGIVRERGIATVLIGMPYLPSGAAGAQCDRVRLFSGALRHKLPPEVRIEERDERFTTHAAERLWRDTGQRRSDFKKYLDSTAAVVLLRSYLEEG